MKLLEEAGLPPGVINFVPGSGGEVGDPALGIAGPRRHPLHRLDRGVPRDVEDDRRQHRDATAATRASSARPAARTSSSPTPRPTSTRWPRRSSAARSSTRGRSARRPRAPTSPRRSGREVSERHARRSSPRSRWATSEDFTQLHERGDRQGGVRRRSRATSTTPRRRATPRSSSAASCDDSVGYFIEPTVVLTTNPHFKLMQEEIFGPVLTVFVYDDDELDETLDAVRRRPRPTRLTGAVFAQRPRRHRRGSPTRCATPPATSTSTTSRPARWSGQQPFGGARASGTNDKAGSIAEPAALGRPAHDQGDVRPAHRLRLPVHGREVAW